MKMVNRLKSILLLFVSTSLFAQKTPLDLEASNNWTNISSTLGMNNQGTFAFFKMLNRPTQSHTITVKSIKNGAQWDFIGLEKPEFSENGNVFYGQIKDTLISLDLVNNRISRTINVSSYRRITCGSKDLLIYSTNEDNRLIVKSTGKVLIIIQNAIFYKVSVDGENLIIKQTDTARAKRETVSILNLRTLKMASIYKGIDTRNFIFDESSKQIAFIETGFNRNQIWYYRIGSKDVHEITNNIPEKLRKFTLSVESNWRFSRNGSQLVFELVSSKEIPINSNSPEIWDYRDAYPLSYYKLKNGKIESWMGHYLCSIDVKGGSFQQLTFENDIVRQSTISSNLSDCYIIESDYSLNESDLRKEPNDSWVTTPVKTYSVVNLQTGKRTVLKNKSRGELRDFSVSPNDKCVVYYDSSDGFYYSTMLGSSITTKLMKIVADTSTLFAHREPVILGWQNVDNFLVSDPYDIWQINPSIKKCTNITSGIGWQNKTMMSLLNIVFQKNASSLLLKGFNTTTKDLLFFKLKLVTNKLTKLCCVKRFYRGLNDNPHLPMEPGDFIQTKTGKFLILWESALEAPNVFYSEDLASFQKISDNNPNNDYNWLTTDLLCYDDSLGNSLQGIIFKPEDFDSNKKYPVIFNYYMRHSDELNRFQSVDINGGDMDIPYLVSNGYLVVQPDLKLNNGNSGGQSALISIEAAINHLMYKSWVDTNRIALTGHSFGAWVTNYFITHSTKKIALCISAAGASNLTSHVYSPWPNLHIQESYVRFGPYRIEHAFGIDAYKYIDNSPIFFAKNIKAPILIIHNQQDNSVSFDQGRSFFIQIRSLNKPVWMISYPNQGHVIHDIDVKLDLKRKEYEFLDFYLKKRSLPNWMNSPIPIF